MSVLKGMLAVGAKGSALMVTDSKATARVFAAWLIRIGFLLVAAVTVAEFAPRRTPINRRRNGRIRLFAAQQRKLVFIRDGLRQFRIALNLR
jgi:hypothetical protein